MTVREELHQLVEQFTDDDLDEVLDYIQWLLRPEDTLTERELARVHRGEDEIERGDVVRLDDLDNPAHG